MFAESVTKQLVQHKQDLSTLQNRQQTHIQNIRQGTEFTDRTHDTVKETIGHTFKSLRSQLDQREKELLTDLGSRTEETKTDLHTRLTTSEDDLKTCTDVLDYINKVLLFASQEDLTELGSSVGETTRAFLDTTVPQTHGIPVAVFNTNGLSKLKSNISEFGSTLTRGIEGENTRGIYMKDNCNIFSQDFHCVHYCL